MNAENTKNFLMVLENQLAAEATGWQKVRQLIQQPDFQSNDQTAKALDLQKIKQTVEQAGKALVEYINRFASRLEQLGTRAKNAGMDAGDLKALEYGAGQTGLSNEAIAKASAMLTTPGAEARLNKLGVNTRDASGQLKASSEIFSDASNTLGALPQSQALETAKQLGLAPDVLVAMQNGLGKFIGDYNQLSASVGVNMATAVSGSDHFMTAQRKFDEVVELLQTKSSGRLTNGLGDIFDNLSKQLLDNAPDVQRVLDGAVTLLLWLAETGEHVAIRLIQAVAELSSWWGSLDDTTQGLIGALGAVAAAWLVLNSAFLMSPIGIVIALAAGLFALYDSYKTWQEGGKTFIDWGAWAPGINAAKDALSWLLDKFTKLKDGTLDWKSGLQTLAAFMSGNWSPAMTGAVDRVKEYFNGFFTDIANKVANSPVWSLLRKLRIISDKDTQDMLNASHPFTISQAAANPLSEQHVRILNNVMGLSTLDNMMGMMPSGRTGRAPWQNETGSATTDNSVGVQQETNIYVQGVSDPHLAARKVADGQFDVNSLLVQKLRRVPV
ncbi:phage tail tape measure protein [Erwinia phyllosphaerae]|uniref:phage tail tape measure protein n=1 Tax=Erwinia phyllosphaerae TaxID=2853256 RepID=UPI001FEEFDD3|nr:phage tail tape measure protein [Erwinia phyllosphaerae]MBV4367922.1 phage tail tape measure protein [Erwinia phyllosphaerae]